MSMRASAMPDGPQALKPIEESRKCLHFFAMLRMLSATGLLHTGYVKGAVALLTVLAGSVAFGALGAWLIVVAYAPQHLPY